MALQAGEGYKQGFVRDANGALLVTSASTGVYAEGFVRDTDGRLLVSGSGSSANALAMPRVLFGATGASTSAVVAATNYLFAEDYSETLATSAVTASNSRAMGKYNYVGASQDSAPLTQKLWMEVVITTSNTALAGTCTVTLRPLTVAANNWAVGAAVITSPAINITPTNSNIFTATTPVNKFADGLYAFVYNLSTIQTGNMLIDAKLLVNNV